MLAPVPERLAAGRAPTCCWCWACCTLLADWPSSSHRRGSGGRRSAAVLALISMFLLPFVVGGLTLLGLADTWLDFRRRSSTPTTGGFDR